MSPTTTPDPAVPPHLPVLMYHAVGTAMPERLRDLSVPPALLAEQLAALTDAGYALVGLTEALAAQHSGRRVVALTFDDGYTDFADTVLGLLARARAGATLYVPSDHVGGHASWLPSPADRLPLLDDAALAAVATEGIEVGSHGAAHVPMDVLPPRTAADHVTRSRERLATATGHAVTSFCYPHGYASARLARQVAGAGYDNACVIGHRLHAPDHDRHRVSRVMVTPGTDAEALLGLVADGPPPLAPAVKRLATPAWRVARRTALRTTGATWT